MLPLCTCVDSEVNQASHVQSTLSYKERHLKKTVLKTISRLIFLGPSEEHVLSCPLLHRVLQRACKRVINTATQHYRLLLGQDQEHHQDDLQSLEKRRDQIAFKTGSAISTFSLHQYHFLYISKTRRHYGETVLPSFFFGGWWVFSVLLLVKFDWRPMAVFTIEKFYIFPHLRTLETITFLNVAILSQIHFSVHLGWTGKNS